MTDSTVATLKTSLRGGLITPTDSGYDEARKVYNGMIGYFGRTLKSCSPGLGLRMFLPRGGKRASIYSASCSGASKNRS